jgi:hypothetical protein
MGQGITRLTFKETSVVKHGATATNFKTSPIKKFARQKTILPPRFSGMCQFKKMTIHGL